MLNSLRNRLLLILILITFFTYFSSFNNPFIWDDEQFITRNLYVQNFDIGKIFTTSTTIGAGVVSDYYRPLTTLSFAFDKIIWGTNPFGFHLTNTVLHTGVGILLFLLLIELGFPQLAAFFISAIFLLHPVQVEAVVYVNSRGDSLFACLLLASFLLFAKSFKSKKSTAFLISSVVLYFLAILAKETALAGILIYPALFLLQRKSFRGSFGKYKKQLIGIFFMLFGEGMYLLFRLTVLNFHNILNYYDVQDAYSTHLALRLFTFAKVIWVYLGILFVPIHLHMERNVNIVTSILSPWVGATILLIAILVFLSIWEHRRKRTLFIGFGLFFTFVFLLPVSGIVPINGILYEHWLYMPIIGISIMIVGIVLAFCPQHLLAKAKAILISFGILLCILYFFFTLSQIQIWADPVEFYTYTLQFAPDSSRLHNNLGMSLEDKGDYKSAVIEYQKALSLDIAYPQIYNNLGNVSMLLGQYSKAEKYLREALNLAPNFSVAKINLIKLYFISGRQKEVKNLFPNDPQAKQIISLFEKEHSY